jgi:hypothetical protein
MIFLFGCVIKMLAHGFSIQIRSYELAVVGFITVKVKVCL